MRPRLIQLAFDRGGLLVVAVLALYLWIAPTGVVDGENAQFALLGAFGGAAHPSGYPSYVLWLRMWSWLPGESPAHTAALATAILAAAQIAILHAACRAWGARPAAASVACAIFAGAPVVLAIYTEAEVFAGNGLVVAAVLWLAAAAGPVRGAWRAALLGVVAGLGLSNHMTCALVAPVGVLGIVRAARECGVARALAVAGAGLVAGLSPYLYLLGAPVHDGAWGDIHDLHGLADMVLRREFGGPGAFAGTGAALPLADNLAELARTLGRTWLWLPGALGFGVLGWRTARRGAGESRWAWGMLLASTLLAGPLLVARFNVQLDTIGRYVVDRFQILPAELLAVPIAVGLDQLAARWSRAHKLPARADLAAGTIAVLVFAAAAGSALPHVLSVHAPAIEDEARNTLESVPPNAVVIGDDDDFAAGITYRQVADAERTDVVYVHWPMAASFGWYRARLAGKGVVLKPGPTAELDLVDGLLAGGRPVFAVPGKRELLAVFPHYPYGLLDRLLPRSASPPPVDDIVALNRDLYSHFEIEYARPGPDDGWPTVIRERYAWAWHQLARMLAAAGEPDQAAAAAQVADEID